MSCLMCALPGDHKTSRECRAAIEAATPEQLAVVDAHLRQPQPPLDLKPETVRVVQELWAKTSE